MTIDTEHTEQHGKLTLTKVKVTEGADRQSTPLQEVRTGWDVHCTGCDEFLAQAVTESEAREVVETDGHGRRCRCGYVADNCWDLVEHTDLMGRIEERPDVIHADVWA